MCIFPFFVHVCHLFNVIWRIILIRDGFNTVWSFPALPIALLSYVVDLSFIYVCFKQIVLNTV